MIVAVAIRQGKTLHMLGLPARLRDLVRRLRDYGLPTEGEAGFVDEVEGFVDQRRAAQIHRRAGAPTPDL